MIPTIHLVKTAGLQTKVKALQAATPAATLAMVTSIGYQVGTQIAFSAPRDTNRFANGWAQAFNAAGLGPIVELPYHRSQYAERLIDRLKLQVSSLETAVNYERRRNAERFRSKSARRDRRIDRQFKGRLAKVEKRLARAKEELLKAESNDLFLVIWGRAGRTDPKTGKRISSRLDTVRTQVFGGTGATVRGPAGWVVAVHNREPHATIVEARTKVYSDAFRSAAGDGRALRRAKSVGVQALKRASGA